MKTILISLFIFVNTTFAGDRFYSVTGKPDGYTRNSGKTTMYFDSRGQLQGYNRGGLISDRTGKPLGKYTGKSNSDVKYRYFR